MRAAAAPEIVQWSYFGIVVVMRWLNHIYRESPSTSRARFVLLGDAPLAKQCEARGEVSAPDQLSERGAVHC